MESALIANTAVSAVLLNQQSAKGTVFSGHEMSLPNASFKPSVKGDIATDSEEFDGDCRLFVLGRVKLVGGFASSVIPNALAEGCSRMGIQSPYWPFRRNELRG